MTLEEKIITLVSKRSDLTEAMLAEKIFGRGGYQQKVNGTCRKLVSQGRLLRKGLGGRDDPFTYKLGIN